MDQSLGLNANCAPNLYRVQVTYILVFQLAHPYLAKLIKPSRTYLQINSR